MSLTSFYYFVFLGISAAIYYISPKKIQWFELLVFSVFFYILAAEPYTIFLLLISTFLAYISALFIKSKWITSVVVITIILNICLWLVFDANGLLIFTTVLLRRIIPVFPVITSFPFFASIGMGYYTLRVIGYIIDCYWGNIEPQNNFFKLFLFVCFFPQMLTGPVSRYEQLMQVYGQHKFSYKNITFGSQRILWGLFKVLVVGSRISPIVDNIWTSDDYSGFYIWIAILLYPLQLYMDFSGSIDIVLGSAEIFDIILPENFNNPFFARNIKEFWQRWHITLGAWGKDYILFPILHTSFFKRLSSICTKKFGKKIGKFIPTQIGMLCLWIFIGLWHGKVRFIIGVTLWYWFLMFLGDLCGPYLNKVIVYLHIKNDSFGWHLFQCVRTYFLFAIGAVVFRADGVSDGLKFIKKLRMIFLREGFNPWIFFDGSIVKLGIDYRDINIIIISLIMIILIGLLREKYGYARNWIAKQSVLFRWLIWLSLFVFVVAYGAYGPEYDSTSFIYQRF